MLKTNWGENSHAAEPSNIYSAACAVTVSVRVYAGLICPTPSRSCVGQSVLT